MTIAHADGPFIVAGRRTPFARAGGELLDYDALALSLHAVRGLLRECAVDPDSVDALRWGIVVVDPRVPQLAREVVVRSEVAARTRAVTVTDNCITGATAVVDLARAMGQGRVEVAIAGGVESMSNPPLLFRRAAARRFLAIVRSRGAGQRIARR